MPVSEALIIPISLEALCLGSGDSAVKFVRQTADFSRLPFNGVTSLNLSSTVLLDDANPIQKPPGVYLHWAIPDGLATADPDSDGSAVATPVPNRWLVTRLLTDRTTPGKPTLTPSFFLVESDHVASDDQFGVVSFPVDTTDPSVQPYQFLGKVTEIKTSWTEPNAPNLLPSLHVLGYGEPSFSALMPNCERVFSLHDETPPNALHTLTYVVLGWFSDPADDPMSRAEWTQSAAPFTGRQNPFRWFFELPAGATVPARSVYQGVIAGIPWNPQNEYLKNDPEDISLFTTVAVGNTAAEAIAALIAQSPTLSGGQLDPVALEALLNALQLSAFSEITRENPGGLADTEDRIHEAGFGRRASGTVWTIRDENGGDTRFPTGFNLGDSLNTLNNIQDAIDRGNAELVSRQRQLFLDWVKYIIWKNTDDPQHPNNVTLARGPLADYLEDQVAAIQALTATLATQNQRLVTQTDQINVDLTAINTTVNPSELSSHPILRLSSVPGPPYWQPSDPVVVMAGQYVMPPARHGGNGQFARAAAAGQLLPIIPSGYLVCLLSSQVLSSLTVRAGAETGSSQIGLSLADLTGLFPISLDTGGNSLGPILLRLLANALLLDPERADLLTARIAALGGSGNPAVIDSQALTQQIASAIQAVVAGAPAPAGSPIDFGGRIPSPLGLKFWTANPWIPIALRWSVLMKPVVYAGTANQHSYLPDAITAGFDLDPDQIDLHYDYKKQGAISKSNPLEGYSNSTLLSRHALIDLKQQIETFKKHLDSSTFPGLLATLNTIEAGLATLPVMAQTLGGFTDALIMRNQVMQLKIADPTETNSLQLLTTQDVRDSVGIHNTAAPQVSTSYNPLRAGELSFDHLTIIDTFGRFKKVTFAANNPTVPVLRISQNLQSADQVDGNGKHDPRVAVLRPRISQPARLAFRWLSASDDQLEMNSDPVTTPVCGWILLNRLEQSLAVFDGAGNPVGSFFALDQGSNELWMGAPATDFFGQTVDQVFGAGSQLNPHLNAFALGISQNGPAFLADFLKILDATLPLIEPSAGAEDPSTAVYFGRPIALARARLDLQLDGLPAFDQSFEALLIDGDLQSQNPDPKVTLRTDAGFGKVAFPVRLGELSKLDDGLVGFFTSSETDSAADYGTLYAPILGLHPDLQTASDSHLVAPAHDTVTLTSGPDSTPVFLSLLVDPRTQVHATMGILPVQSIDIPPHHYSAVLENMAVTFLTAPVLAEIGAFGVPVPLAPRGTWSWLNVAPDGTFMTSGVGPPIQVARFDFAPQEALEGWLRLEHSIDD